jgi:hypothetical protein
MSTHLVLNKTADMKQYQRSRWKDLPDWKKTDIWLRNKHKITYADYVRMWDEQGGACDICLNDISTDRHAKNKAVVDHCHITMRIRGLLCQNCNRALGLVKESETTLKNMLEYIR